MATVAAIRASPTSSLHTSTQFENGPRIFAARPSRLPSSTAAASRLWSSYSCFSSSRSLAKLARRQVKSRRWNTAGVSSSPRCEAETDTDGKIPFGYTRKDVVLIGVGLLGFGVGLKYGLEFLGLDSIRAGNAVQLTMVLGLTIGWISTYVFRVSSKEMTYAKQLKDYENKVMQKRLEEMPEAELESMLAQIEEDKRILRENRDKLL